MALPFAEIPLLAGILLAWSLAAPPGPANALMAHVAATRGFAAGWLTGLGAVAGDLVMFLLMGFGIVRVVALVPWLDVALGLVGAGLMAYFAYEAFRTADRPATEATGLGGFARSFVIIVTSPFNWAWWFTVGTSLFTQLGWGIAVGFFVGLVAWTAAWSGLTRAGAARFERFRVFVAYGAAAVLVLFAVLVGAFAVQRAFELL